MNLIEQMLKEHKKLSREERKKSIKVTESVNEGRRNFTIEFESPYRAFEPETADYQASTPEEAFEMFLSEFGNEFIDRVYQIYDESDFVWYVSDEGFIYPAEDWYNNLDFVDNREDSIVRGDDDPGFDEYDVKREPIGSGFDYGDEVWFYDESGIKVTGIIVDDIAEDDSYAVWIPDEGQEEFDDYGDNDVRYIDIHELHKLEESTKVTEAVHNYVIRTKAGDDYTIPAGDSKDALASFKRRFPAEEIDKFYDEDGEYYCPISGEILNDSLHEDTVKKKNGKWTNRGEDGKEHGEFDTKKEADAQRKAMYANGYKGESIKKVNEAYLGLSLGKLAPFDQNAWDGYAGAAGFGKDDPLIYRGQEFDVIVGQSYDNEKQAEVDIEMFDESVDEDGFVAYDSIEARSPAMSLQKAIRLANNLIDKYDVKDFSMNDFMEDLENMDFDIQVF